MDEEKKIEELEIQMGETEPADSPERPERWKYNSQKFPSASAKKTPFRSALFLLLVAVSGFVIGQIVLFLLPTGSGVNNLKVMQKLMVLEACVDRFFLDETDGDNLAAGIYKGYMAGLGDPYAAYYTKEEYDQLMEQDSGEYMGIGVTVRLDTDTGYVLVEQVDKDGPAYNAGVKKGDLITAVDGVDSVGLGLQGTVSAIKGNKEPSVLTILREGESLEITVDKTEILMETVQWEMRQDHIGYIAVSQFVKNTSDQFNQALEELQAQGMTSLIIDLRDNGGGLLTTCLDMVSRFVPDEQLIVYTEDKNGDRVEFHSDSVDVVDVPMVLLVNGNSASASEIMTGCLKDYDIATVVGQTTFGKGIVQNILPLADGSAVKMTVSRYYTPLGNDIHEAGIVPDVTVEMSEEQWAAAQEDENADAQLQEAQKILRNQGDQQAAS